MMAAHEPERATGAQIDLADSELLPGRIPPQGELFGLRPGREHSRRWCIEIAHKTDRGGGLLNGKARRCGIGRKHVTFPPCWCWRDVARDCRTFAPTRRGTTRSIRPLPLSPRAAGAAGGAAHRVLARSVRRARAPSDASKWSAARGGMVPPIRPRWPHPAPVERGLLVL